ncbi:MAG: rhamnogalacturonan acetylesterase [Sphaerochaetaceae bacterium]|nr:rhamnogalacturonan acetylesterase [uncultured Sphaerochaeta sp.]MDC7229959.1 rhamnogalacturonan acetylesterase [Sphaerochaetaceae bacterium]
MNTLFLLGDSTCAPKEDDKRPETGWGMYIESYIDSFWGVTNLALNGRSTKSFLEEGVFERCLGALESGDFVFIQFGHNDSKKDKERFTEPWSTFQGNLACMAESVLSKHSTPVFLTPIARRRFLPDGSLEYTHGEYPHAMISLCQARGYACIDMHKTTFSLLEQMGDEDSKELFLHLKAGEHPNYPEGVADDTHLNEKGARVVCSLIISLLKEKYPEFPFLGLR